MRRVHRRPLELPVRLDLRLRAAACTAATARDDWRRYRTLAAARPVVDTLRAMAGTRERCFYCRDSRAADVEHYVPITEDAQLTFRWPNLLWVCPECNRRKLNQFPRDAGVPLLIDPAATDPWEHVVLDTATGRLAPRFLVDGTLDSRGDATLEVITPINFEAVTEGRRLAIRRLRRAATDVLRFGDQPETRRGLRFAVDEDDFGVSGWFVAKEGRVEVPFHDLRAEWPLVWRRLAKWTAAAELGVR